MKNMKVILAILLTVCFASLQAARAQAQMPSPEQIRAAASDPALLTQLLAANPSLADRILSSVASDAVSIGGDADAIVARIQALSAEVLRGARQPGQARRMMDKMARFAMGAAPEDPALRARLAGAVADAALASGRGRRQINDMIRGIAAAGVVEAEDADEAAAVATAVMERAIAASGSLSTADRQALIASVAAASVAAAGANQGEASAVAAAVIRAARNAGGDATAIANLVAVVGAAAIEAADNSVDEAVAASMVNAAGAGLEATVVASISLAGQESSVVAAAVGAAIDTAAAQRAANAPVRQLGTTTSVAVVETVAEVDVSDVPTEANVYEGQ